MLNYAGKCDSFIEENCGDMKKSNARTHQSTEIVVKENPPNSQTSRVVIRGNFTSIVFYRYLGTPTGCSYRNGRAGQSFTLLEEGDAQIHISDAMEFECTFTQKDSNGASEIFSTTERGRKQAPKLTNRASGDTRSNAEVTGPVHPRGLETNADYSTEDFVAGQKLEKSSRYSLQDAKLAPEVLVENSEMTSGRPISINVEVILPFSTGRDAAPISVSICQKFAGFKTDSRSPGAEDLDSANNCDSIRIGIKVERKHEQHPDAASCSEPSRAGNLQTEEVAGSNLSSLSVNEGLVSRERPPESELGAVEGRAADMAREEESVEAHVVHAYSAGRETLGKETLEKQILDEFDRRVNHMVLNRVRGPALVPFRGSLLTPTEKDAMLAKAAAEEFQIPKGIVKQMSLRLAKHSCLE